MLLPGRLLAAVLLLTGLALAHADDTIVKDYDISLSQEECRQTSTGILHSLAGPDMPVMQLEPLVLPGACWHSRGSLPFTRRLCGLSSSPGGNRDGISCLSC